MLIQGSFEASHIVRELIAREYAFSCVWEDKEGLEEHGVRVAHHKGLWTVGKFTYSIMVDWFSLGDEGSIDTKNDLLRGFIQAKIKMYDRESREDYAKIIADAINYWVSSLQKITQIDCLQAGRNAMIDEKTGDFLFSPRQEEWKK